MAIVINGSGTVTGLAVGGLPDGTVDAGTLATNSVDSAELIDGAVDNSHMAAMAASKLTGALPAISGAALTNIVNHAGTDAFAANSTLQWTAVNDSAIVAFNRDTSDDCFDTDSSFNTSTYKFTASAAGVYMFWYSILTGQEDTSNGFGFLKNSSKLHYCASGNAHFSVHENDNYDHIQTAFCVVPLAATDTMAVCASSEGDYYGQKSSWGGCRLK